MGTCQTKEAENDAKNSGNHVAHDIANNIPCDDDLNPSEKRDGSKSVHFADDFGDVEIVSSEEVQTIKSPTSNSNEKLTPEEEKKRLEAEISLIQNMLREKLKLEAEIKKIESQLRMNQLKERSMRLLALCREESQRLEVSIHDMHMHEIEDKHKEIAPVIAKHIRAASARIAAARRASAAPPSGLKLKKKLPRVVRKSRKMVTREAVNAPNPEEDDSHLPLIVQLSRTEARKYSGRKLEEAKYRKKLERQNKLREATRKEAYCREKIAKETAAMEDAVIEAEVWESMAKDANHREDEARNDEDWEGAEMEKAAAAIAWAEVDTWKTVAKDASRKILKFNAEANIQANTKEKLLTWEEEKSIELSALSDSEMGVPSTVFLGDIKARQLDKGMENDVNAAPKKNNAKTELTTKDAVVEANARKHVEAMKRNEKEIPNEATPLPFSAPSFDNARPGRFPKDSTSESSGNLEKNPEIARHQSGPKSLTFIQMAKENLGLQREKSGGRAGVQDVSKKSSRHRPVRRTYSGMSEVSMDSISSLAQVVAKIAVEAGLANAADAEESHPPINSVTVNKRESVAAKEKITSPQLLVAKSVNTPQSKSDYEANKLAKKSWAQAAAMAAIRAGVAQPTNGAFQECDENATEAEMAAKVSMAQAATAAAFKAGIAHANAQAAKTLSDVNANVRPIDQSPTNKASPVKLNDSKTEVGILETNPVPQSQAQSVQETEIKAQEPADTNARTKMVSKKSLAEAAAMAAVKAGIAIANEEVAKQLDDNHIEAKMVPEQPLIQAATSVVAETGIVQAGEKTETKSDEPNYMADSCTKGAQNDERLSAHIIHKINSVGKSANESLLNAAESVQTNNDNTQVNNASSELEKLAKDASHGFDVGALRYDNLQKNERTTSEGDKLTNEPPEQATVRGESLVKPQEGAIAELDCSNHDAEEGLDQVDTIINVKGVIARTNQKGATQHYGTIGESEISKEEMLGQVATIDDVLDTNVESKEDAAPSPSGVTGEAVKSAKESLVLAVALGKMQVKQVDDANSEDEKSAQRSFAKIQSKSLNAYIEKLARAVKSESASSAFEAIEGEHAETNEVVANQRGVGKGSNEESMEKSFDKEGNHVDSRNIERSYNETSNQVPTVGEAGTALDDVTAAEQFDHTNSEGEMSPETMLTERPFAQVTEVRSEQQSEIASRKAPESVGAMAGSKSYAKRSTLPVWVKPKASPHEEGLPDGVPVWAKARTKLKSSGKADTMMKGGVSSTQSIKNKPVNESPEKTHRNTPRYGQNVVKVESKDEAAASPAASSESAKLAKESLVVSASLSQVQDEISHTNEPVKQLGGANSEDEKAPEGNANKEKLARKVKSKAVSSALGEHEGEYAEINVAVANQCGVGKGKNEESMEKLFSNAPVESGVAKIIETKDGAANPVSRVSTVGEAGASLNEGEKSVEKLLTQIPISQDTEAGCAQQSETACSTTTKSAVTHTGDSMVGSKSYAKKSNLPVWARPKASPHEESLPDGAPAWAKARTKLKYTGKADTIRKDGVSSTQSIGKKHVNESPEKKYGKSAGYVQNLANLTATSPKTDNVALKATEPNLAASQVCQNESLKSDKEYDALSSEVLSNDPMASPMTDVVVSGESKINDLILAPSEGGREGLSATSSARLSEAVVENPQSPKPKTVDLNLIGTRLGSKAGKDSKLAGKTNDVTQLYLKNAKSGGKTPVKKQPIEFTGASRKPKTSNTSQPLYSNQRAGLRKTSAGAAMLSSKVV